MVPLLDSLVDAECWASACCLGLLKDERAIPALEQMLVAIRSPQQRQLHQPGFGLWFPLSRHRIAALFGTWGPPTIVATLRQAFERIWHWQKQGYCYWTEDDYQDYLCCALGQRGAFGALSGLDLYGPRLRLAMIALASGSLLTDEISENVTHSLIRNSEFKDEQYFQCQSSGSVEIWEARSDTCVYRSASQMYKINAMCWSPDGTRIAFGGHNKTVVVWNVEPLFTKS